MLHTFVFSAHTLPAYSVVATSGSAGTVTEVELKVGLRLLRLTYLQQRVLLEPLLPLQILVQLMYLRPTLDLKLILLLAWMLAAERAPAVVPPTSSCAEDTGSSGNSTSGPHFVAYGYNHVNNILPDVADAKGFTVL